MSETADKKQFLGLKGVKTLLDGLKGEYSPLGHKHDTSEIDGYVEPVQSKWTQNDKTSADYIVDRTHYHTPLTQNTEYGYLESPTVGIHLLQDLTGEYPYVLNVLKAENIARTFNETNYHFRLDVGMILSVGTVSNLISNDNLTSNAEMLDDINYKSQINESGINIYFILDLSTLSEENKVKFTVLGIYLELESETALGQLEWIKSQILSYVTLDTNYLDMNIATKTYVDESIITDYNKLSNIPIIPISEITGYGASYELTKSTGTYDMYKIVLSKDFVTPNKIITMENNTSKNIWFDFYLLSNDGREMLTNVSLVLQGIGKKYYIFRTVSHDNQTGSCYIENIVDNIQYIIKYDADWNYISTTQRSYSDSDMVLYNANKNSESESYTPTADTDLSTKKYVDDAKTATINDILNTSYSQIVMTDTINGYQYIMQMCEGKLISYCIASSITVTTLPSKLEYVVGEIFDATGMIVTAICQDGSSREITGYTYSDNTLNLDDTSVEISYTENGQTFTTTIAITVTETISTEENTETIE